ncbi:MAG: hypothetical protein WDA11_07200 [Thiohalomonadaceae bacterium]
MSLPSWPLRGLHRQEGGSLVAAVFLITVLALMGVFLSRLLVTTTTETIIEWYSAQALYAAESGVDDAAYQLVQNTATPPTPGTTAATAEVANEAVDATSWFTTTVTVLTATPTKTVYEIRSAGIAGGTSANPMAQRTLVVQFMP